MPRPSSSAGRGSSSIGSGGKSAAGEEDRESSYGGDSAGGGAGDHLDNGASNTHNNNNNNSKIRNGSGPGENHSQMMHAAEAELKRAGKSCLVLSNLKWSSSPLYTGILVY